MYQRKSHSLKVQSVDQVVKENVTYDESQRLNSTKDTLNENVFSVTGVKVNQRLKKKAKDC